MDLNIAAVADDRCFLFLWCGSGEEALEAGRHCLQNWGFARCEDICWIKTNREAPRHRHGQGRQDPYLGSVGQDPKSMLVHTKEHCLMGRRGKVHRSTDGHLIHANCDTDVIVSEEPEPLGSCRKPNEMYGIIERFCQGRRRLELFGEDHNIRRGWVTVGNRLSTSTYDQTQYLSHFVPMGNPVPGPGEVLQVQSRPEAPHLLPENPEIERCRPKSPPKRA